MEQKVKRSPGIHLTFERRDSFDLSELLNGKIGLQEQDQIIANVGASSKELFIDVDDLRVLAAVDSVEWVDSKVLAQRCSVKFITIERLVKFGLLLTSENSARLPDLESASLWDQNALYYHKRTKWNGTREQKGLPATAEAAESWVAENSVVFSELNEKYGAAPSHFHQRTDQDSRINLPLDSYSSPLATLLQARHTVRLFDTTKPLGLDKLSTVLFHTFGCHGYTNLSEEMIALKKTSPSGGALHPVEVYPLVISVDGLSPGIYHYHVGDHALEPLRELDEAQARAMAKTLVAGQAFYGSAHVLLLYTARFERNFWKYRDHGKAYRVIQLDLGHLSQTLYLMSTEIGLGAFFTAACNDEKMELELDIDGIREGALAIGGIGIPAPNGDILSFPTKSYVPRQTEI